MNRHLIRKIYWEEHVMTSAKRLSLTIDSGWKDVAEVALT